MAITGSIGTKEWWESAANEALNIGFSAIETKLTQKKTTSGTSATKTVTEAYPKWLPWGLGGLAAVAIVLIIVKR